MSFNFFDEDQKMVDNVKNKDISNNKDIKKLKEEFVEDPRFKNFVNSLAIFSSMFIEKYFVKESSISFNSFKELNRLFSKTFFHEKFNAKIFSSFLINKVFKIHFINLHMISDELKYESFINKIISEFHGGNGFIFKSVSNLDKEKSIENTKIELKKLLSKESTLFIYHILERIKRKKHSDKKYYDEVNDSIFFLSEDKDFNKSFYKVVNGAFNNHMKSRFDLYTRLRQKRFYDLIGEETIKQLSYLKKSNCHFSKKVDYNLNIESRKEEFDLFMSETPQFFYPSYASIGFKGAGQLKHYKEYLKNLDNHDYLYNLTEKGWKFLLKQNKNYLLRSNRFLEVGVFCANNELKDAWLRNDCLNSLFSTIKEIKSNTYNFSDILSKLIYLILSKEVLEHKKPISKFKILKDSPRLIDNGDKSKQKIIVKKMSLDIKECFENISSFNPSIQYLSKEYHSFKNILYFFYCLLQLEEYDFSNNIDKEIDDILTRIKVAQCKQDIIVQEEMIENTNLFENIYTNLNINELNGEFWGNYFVFLNEDNFRLIYKSLYPYIGKIGDIISNTINISNNCIDLQDELLNIYKDIFNIKSQDMYNLMLEFFDYIFYSSNRLKEQNQKLTSDQIVKLLFKNIKSFDKLLELSDIWHNKKSALETRKENIEIFDYIDFTDFNLYNNENNTFIFEETTFKLIKDTYCLADEGDTMHHCVSRNYENLCKKGKYYVFQTPRTTSNKRATLGMDYSRHDNKFIFSQMYSYSNSVLCDDQLKVAHDFISYLNNELALINKEKVA